MDKLVKTSNHLQRSYTYHLTQPVGKNFDPGFGPELTPKQMLELGVFDGYYRSVTPHEFPTDWFTNAKLSDTPNPKLNFFGIHASKTLAYWQQKGWINPQDPNGWFQWYCRYFMGRRTLDDVRQITRWKAMTRHIAQIKKHCRVGDMSCRPRQRQALLHWAYDSRKF